MPHHAMPWKCGDHAMPWEHPAALLLTSGSPIPLPCTPPQMCRSRPRCLTVLKLGMFALLAWDTGNSAGGLQRWGSGVPSGDSMPSVHDMPSVPSPPPATCSVSEAVAFRLWVGEQSSADCPGEQPWGNSDVAPLAASNGSGNGGADAVAAGEPAAASCCRASSLPLVALVAEVGQVWYAAAC